MPGHHDAARQLPGAIVVPASDFFSNIPAGDSNDGRFKLAPDRGATLFFKGGVYSMFDFDSTGADQVITLDGGTLRIYGNANVGPRAVKRDAEYRRAIANHTYY